MTEKYGELKDCPFCGNSWGPPQLEKSDEGRYQYGCTNIHCGGSAGWGNTKAEALELWNKRA